MKKLIITSAIFALIVAPLVIANSAKAANEVIFDADTTIDLTDPDVNITVMNGSIVDSITPGAGTISVTMSNGGQLTLRSSDRKTLSNDSSFQSTFICGDTNSELQVTGGTGTNTFTVTVSSTACTTSSGTSSSYTPPSSSSTPSQGTTTGTTETTQTTSTEIAETTETTTSAPTETAKTTASAPTSSFADKIKTIISEASEVISAKVETLIAKVGATRNLTMEQTATAKYVKSLIQKTSGTTTATENAMTNFIAYGTPTTKVLGAGERAGVLNSFKKSYNKLPQTEIDWQDAIKVANGRFPSQQSIAQEKEALKVFGKIYKKMPDFKNANDEAALKIMAYGIRPVLRNTNSEKAAIKSFESIYKRKPATTEEWDITRAIAYSGAKR
ncbi:MAG: hypothetical protein V1891_00400 [bacterium]